MIARNADELFLFPQKIQEYIYYINGLIGLIDFIKNTKTYKSLLQN